MDNFTSLVLEVWTDKVSLELLAAQTHLKHDKGSRINAVFIRVTNNNSRQIR